MVVTVAVAVMRPRAGWQDRDDEAVEAGRATGASLAHFEVSMHEASQAARPRVAVAAAADPMALA